MAALRKYDWLATREFQKRCMPEAIIVDRLHDLGYRFELLDAA